MIQYLCNLQHGGGKMNFGKIKLAGTDLDGTLFTDEKKIDSRTKSAIKNAHKKGMQIIPVTGRPLSGLSKEITDIKEIEYAITNNGAQIIDLKTNNPIYSRQIDNETSLKIIKKADDLNTVFEVFTGGFGYLTSKSMDNYMKTHGETPVGIYIKNSRKIIDNIYDFVEKNECNIDEIFITISDETMQKEIENMLDEFENIQYWSIFGKFIEVTHKDADKGKAFKYLADYLKINLADTIAFGDGENDISLLKTAGISVSMANAEPCVKEIATLATASNNDFGVAKILEQI